MLNVFLKNNKFIDIYLYTVMTCGSTQVSLFM